VFSARSTWGGPGARTTTEVRRFSRRSELTSGVGVPPVSASAARAFFGDADAWNPETLLLSALAQCHLLAFLRQAGLAGWEVAEAVVDANGELTLNADGAGGFVAASLAPRTLFSDWEPSADELLGLHAEAHRQCFIANSLSFPVSLLPDAGWAPSGA